MRSARSKPGRRPPAQNRAKGAPPAAAIWAEPRNLFFFRTGRLNGPEGEEICEILALAESGAILRSPPDLGLGDAITLELNSVHRLGGFVAWSEGGRIGLEFDDRRKVRAVLAGRELSHPYRAPRLGLRCALEIRLGSRRLKTECHDISEGGIKVELPAGHRAGSEAIVALDGLEPVAGQIRWWREGRAGISFEQPIPAGDFTRWVTTRLEPRAG
jgi:hypothetical protein